MKQIAIVHTVQSVADTFWKQLKDYLGTEVKIYNLWDQFLSVNPNEVGEFTQNNKNRLFLDIKNAELTGADVIVVSCSTLTPHLGLIRPYISVPVIAIDDAMTKKAVETGSRILVCATAGSTIQPTTDKLMEDAEKAGKKITVDQMVVTEAYKAMQAADMPKHDRILTEAMKEVRGFDCIVLAQASMAGCEEAIQKETGIRTFSSPKLCMELVKETLGL